MKKINELFAVLKEVSDHPKKQFRFFLENKQQVFGCLPVYTPLPLLYAAGFIPFGIWGGHIVPKRAGKYNPAFTCSIMRSILEYGMTQEYNGITAVTLPILCDTMRGMASAWVAGIPDIPIFPFIQPQNRNSPSAQKYLVDEYRDLSMRIERLVRQKITDESIHIAIDIYNAHHKVMRMFAETATRHLSIITPRMRHYVFKSAWFMDVQKHTAIVTDIINELNTLEPCSWKGKKILLSGITAEPNELLALFEENGIAVIADDIAQESRQYRADYNSGADPFERLASQWMNMRGCSLVHEQDVWAHSKFVINLAKQSGADAVVICLMKFCDPEEYDLPSIQQLAEENNLFCLVLEIDQSIKNNAQAVTKIQTFSEL